MKKQYTATKSFLYGTRRLQAGDTFEAKPSVGRILVEVAKKAVPVREPGSINAPPRALAKRVSKPSEDDLAAARSEYQDATGKRPFHGWDAETLRAKIVEAAAEEPPAEDEPAPESTETAEEAPEEPKVEDGE